MVRPSDVNVQVYFVFSNNNKMRGNIVKMSLKICKTAFVIDYFSKELLTPETFKQYSSFSTTL